jgi:diaminopropionate ammonia-lyase family
MQGYAVMADELLDALESAAPSPWSHVFIQGGVGAIVAGVSSYFWQHFGALRPSFLVVEPEQADCLLQSAVFGQAAAASGSVDSVMAGLACGEASPLAWRFLQPCIDQFVTVSDARAVQAMRLLAQPVYGDIPLLSGESGCAGFAALLYIAQSPELRLRAGIGPQSRVLLINTEGATAPGIYTALVGKTASEVLAAQSAWTASRTDASGAAPIAGGVPA